MNRILTIAAFAALIAAPAMAADSVRVSTAGKSVEQLHTDLVKAAKSVCNRAITSTTTYSLAEERAACLRDTVADAVAQVGDPTLMAMAAATAR